MAQNLNKRLYRKWLYYIILCFLFCFIQKIYCPLHSLFFLPFKRMLQCFSRLYVEFLNTGYGYLRFFLSDFYLQMMLLILLFEKTTHPIYLALAKLFSGLSWNTNSINQCRQQLHLTSPCPPGLSPPTVCGDSSPSATSLLAQPRSAASPAACCWYYPNSSPQI